VSSDRLPSLNRSIKVVEVSSGRRIDVAVPGPTRNMISSQVACRQLSCSHWRDSPEALTALLRSIDDDIVGVASMEYKVPATGYRCAFSRRDGVVGLASTLEGAAAIERGERHEFRRSPDRGLTAGGGGAPTSLEWKTPSPTEGEYKGQGLLRCLSRRFRWGAGSCFRAAASITDGCR